MRDRLDSRNLPGMEAIEQCNTYHAKIAGRRLLKLPDAKSAFKVYFVDIVGRQQPARFVWGLCGRSQDDFLRTLESRGLEGLGFVVAFPHVAKVFWFGPANETLLNVTGFKTETLEPLSRERGEGYVEFACLAEALIAADEYRFWAEAETVEDYLASWSPFAEAPLKNHRKLAAYWGGG